MYTRPRQIDRPENTVNTEPDDNATYPRACERTLAELAKAVRLQEDLRTRLKETEQRVAVLRPLAVGLLAQCSADERTDLSDRFALSELLGETSHDRSGDLLRQVRDIFRASAPAPRGAGDIIATLEARGVACSSKAVYNAIQRLALNGQLVRIARGRYLAPGHGFTIDTSDNLLD